MSSPVDALAGAFETAAVIGRTGMLRPTRPDRMVRAVQILRRYGATSVGGFLATAARHPEVTAVIDERGSLTYSELDGRSSALARGLAGLGVTADSRVGVLCRDHRGFVDTTLALSKLGADIVYLNTAFAGPQLVEVAEREDVAAVVADEEFETTVQGLPERVARVVAWHDGDVDGPTVESLIASNDAAPLDPPPSASGIVILTSGTTGTPKGARRSGSASNAAGMVAVLSKIPLRGGGTTVIAAPLFHSWGMAHLLLAIALGSTVVLRRRFDPAATLEAVARNRADALVVVPVMLQRILDLPQDVRAAHDTSSLRIIASSGSALPGGLAQRCMDAFGDVLYNLYGSTEVSWATIATPADLRAAPGTAGRPPRGTVVRLVDEDGREVAPGEVGRIFVANKMPFEGYTGGGSKEVLEGMMSTGDVGRFDDDGRLFVEGRDDDMIVSGGENLFPREVEDLLAQHDDVADVAVIGVDDEEFGQRLKAFVVPVPGASLDGDEVKGYVRERLARFKVPRDVEIVDELPRNPTGKVLKRELRER